MFTKLTWNIQDGKVISGTVQGPGFILGMPVLRKFVPIFDMENQRIGFAQRPN